MLSKRTSGWVAAAAAASLLLASPALAGPGRIARRKENQQDRIAQGIRSGQLTAGEAARLERGEARLNREIRDMREDNGGRLTAADRARIELQQDRLSRRIYRQKHDGQTRH